MGVDTSELIVPFLGAIQAAFSVLLTIVFGVIAAQCNLLSVNAAKEVSKLCVRMFLPALLIYKIGSNLHQDTGVRYVPILSMSYLVRREMYANLAFLSLVDILHPSLHNGRPHAYPHLQATSMGDTGNRLQQHYESSNSPHPVA